MPQWKATHPRIQAELLRFREFSYSNKKDKRERVSKGGRRWTWEELREEANMIKTHCAKFSKKLLDCVFS